MQHGKTSVSHVYSYCFCYYYYHSKTANTFTPPSLRRLVQGNLVLHLHSGLVLGKGCGRGLRAGLAAIIKRPCVDKSEMLKQQIPFETYFPPTAYGPECQRHVPWKSPLRHGLLTSSRYSDFPFCEKCQCQSHPRIPGLWLRGLQRTHGLANTWDRLF